MVCGMCAKLNQEDEKMLQISNYSLYVLQN